MKILNGVLVAVVLVMGAEWVLPRLATEDQQGRIARMIAEKTGSSSALACTIDLTALDSAQRERHEGIARQVMGAIQEVKELPNGYAFRLPLETDMILATAEFISLEQKCCGFIGFNLDIKPDNGPMWLTLTGGPGAKEFLQGEMGMN